MPTHFYKVILGEFEAGDLEMFAFVAPNQMEPLDGQPGDYLVAVDLVEAISGLDFFSALPDSMEIVLEEKIAINWPIE